MQPKIAVVGSLNMDYVVNVVRRPEAGETVLADGLRLVPGGKGANQACTIGKMGAEVLMFGAVGQDSNGDALLTSLQAAGVDTRYIWRIDKPTGVAFIYVDKSSDNCIVVIQGANAAVGRDYIDKNIEALQSCDVVIFQLEIPLDTVTYAAQKLSAAGKTVILDPAPAPGPLPTELLRNVTYLKPNETELAILSGCSSNEVEAACAQLFQQGASSILVSLGKNGSYFAKRGSAGFYTPAEKVEAVDTTAAGDSFTAAFAYAVSMGKPERDAIRFATTIAAVVVQRDGAQTSIPDKEEIQKIWHHCFCERKDFL